MSQLSEVRCKSSLVGAFCHDFTAFIRRPSAKMFGAVEESWSAHRAGRFWGRLLEPRVLVQVADRSAQDRWCAHPRNQHRIARHHDCSYRDLARGGIEDHGARRMCRDRGAAAAEACWLMGERWGARAPRDRCAVWLIIMH